MNGTDSNVTTQFKFNIFYVNPETTIKNWFALTFGGFIIMCFLYAFSPNQSGFFLSWYFLLFISSALIWLGIRVPYLLFKQLFKVVVLCKDNGEQWVLVKKNDASIQVVQYHIWWNYDSASGGNGICIWLQLTGDQDEKLILYNRYDGNDNVPDGIEYSKHMEHYASHVKEKGDFFETNRSLVELYHNLMVHNNSHQTKWNLK